MTMGLKTENLLARLTSPYPATQAAPSSLPVGFGLLAEALRPTVIHTMGDGIFAWHRYLNGLSMSDFSGSGRTATFDYIDNIDLNDVGAENIDVPIGAGVAQTRLSQSFQVKRPAQTLNASITLRLKKFGLPTSNFTVRIGTTRDTSGATVSATSSASALGVSYANVVVTGFGNLPLVVGTTFYITVEYTGGDATNYIAWGQNTSGGQITPGSPYYADTLDTHGDFRIPTATFPRTDNWGIASLLADGAGGVDVDGHSGALRYSGQYFTDVRNLGSFTMMLSVKANNWSDTTFGVSQTNLFCTTDSTSQTGFSLGVDVNGHPWMQRYSSSLVTFERKTSTRTLTAGVKYDLAYVYDDTLRAVTFYINGVGETALAFSVTGGVSTIGQGDRANWLADDGLGNNDLALDGQASDLMIWSRTMTATEIDQARDPWGGTANAIAYDTDSWSGDHALKVTPTYVDQYVQKSYALPKDWSAYKYLSIMAKGASAGILLNVDLWDGTQFVNITNITTTTVYQEFFLDMSAVANRTAIGKIRFTFKNIGTAFIDQIRLLQVV